jgi:hypothetical protein
MYISRSALKPKTEIKPKNEECLIIIVDPDSQWTVR